MICRRNQMCALSLSLGLCSVQTNKYQSIIYILYAYTVYIIYASYRMYCFELTDRSVVQWVMCGAIAVLRTLRFNFIAWKYLATHRNTVYNCIPWLCFTSSSGDIKIPQAYFPVVWFPLTSWFPVKTCHYFIALRVVITSRTQLAVAMPTSFASHRPWVHWKIHGAGVAQLFFFISWARWCCKLTA